MPDSDLSIKDATVTCSGAPVQIEGTLSDGRCFYFRARHRSITLGVGDTPDAAVAEDRIGVKLMGFDDDRHALSFIDEEHAMALLRFLVATFTHCESWGGR